MRLEFDKSTPVHEQLQRVGDAKTPGRKHQKRKGVKAKQRASDALKRSAKHKEIESAKFHARVAAYWRGELDEYPKAKP